MGITNFSSWIREQYPGSFVPIQNNRVYDYIYIDVNYLLHNSIYDCKNENEFLVKLRNHLDVIFSNFIAIKKVFLALDGPGSFAKVSLQRKRRIILSEKSDKIDEKTINPLWLTPGIETMNKIEIIIENYINKFKNKYKYTNPTFHLLKSNENDEGEIKICKNIIDNGKNNLSDKHLIIGNDSDLIVISMALKPIFNINILVKYKNGNFLVSLEKLLKEHAKQININKKIMELTESCIRDDFVLISIMMGNDYLPKLSFVNCDKMWKCYYEYIKNREESEFLIKNVNYNLESFKKFLYTLYQTLSKNFKKIDIKTYSHDRTKNYLEGILWNVNMYQNGKCPKYDYIYNYNSSPHPFELYFFVCSEKEILQVPKSNIIPLPPEIYALLILPKKASYLISDKFKNLMENELSYLYEECDSCNKFKINLKLYLKNVNDKKIYIEELKKYKIHKKVHNKNLDFNKIYNIIKLVDKKNI